MIRNVRPCPWAASVTALWRFVWDSARSNPATFLALISALTALAATVVGPLVSFYTTRLQIRATLVSANRQAWINALRDDLSELFAILTQGFALGTQETERRTRVALLTSRIQLRLNPVEKPSKTLLDLIQKLQALTVQALDDGSVNADNERNFLALMNSAVSTSQEILKAEWKRVKKGR